MKIQCYKYYQDLYQINVGVTFCKKFTATLSSSDRVERSAGLTIHKEDSVMVYIDPEFMNFGIVAHESFHAADYILARASAEFSPDGTNEHYAYLIGWIGRCIEKAWKHHQGTTNGK